MSRSRNSPLQIHCYLRTPHHPNRREENSYNNNNNNNNNNNDDDDDNDNNGLFAIYHMQETKKN